MLRSDLGMAKLRKERATAVSKADGLDDARKPLHLTKPAQTLRKRIKTNDAIKINF